MKRFIYLYTLFLCSCSNLIINESAPQKVPNIPESISPIVSIINNSAKQLGIFTISSENDKVTFSPGNLQLELDLSGCPLKWHFATHQYDYVGFEGSNRWSSISVDLFGWSTDLGGLAWGVNPSTNNYDYVGEFKDWGENPELISNLGKGWRTLSMKEYYYLFQKRQCSTLSSVPNARFAFIKVNNVVGLLIFPDKICWNEREMGPIPSSINNNSVGLLDIYSVSQFNNIEEAGCVFLPTAGYRIGFNLMEDGISGSYWSSTTDGTTKAYYISFYDEELFPRNSFYRSYGFSVRLVKDL